jgi:hypothetical protein
MGGDDMDDHICGMLNEKRRRCKRPNDIEKWERKQGMAIAIRTEHRGSFESSASGKASAATKPMRAPPTAPAAPKERIVSSK